MQLYYLYIKKKKFYEIAPCPLRAQSLQNHHWSSAFLQRGEKTMASTLYNTYSAHSHSLNNSKTSEHWGKFLRDTRIFQIRVLFPFLNQQVFFFFLNIKANSWHGALQRRHQGLPGRWCALPKSPPSRRKDTNVERRWVGGGGFWVGSYWQGWSEGGYGDWYRRTGAELISSLVHLLQFIVSFIFFPVSFLLNFLQILKHRVGVFLGKNLKCDTKVYIIIRVNNKTI